MKITARMLLRRVARPQPKSNARTLKRLSVMAPELLNLPQLHNLIPMVPLQLPPLIPMAHPKLPPAVKLPASSALMPHHKAAKMSSEPSAARCQSRLPSKCQERSAPTFPSWLALRWHVKCLLKSASPSQCPSAGPWPGKCQGMFLNRNAVKCHARSAAASQLRSPSKCQDKYQDRSAKVTICETFKHSFLCTHLNTSSQYYVTVVLDFIRIKPLPVILTRLRNEEQIWISVV